MPGDPSCIKSGELNRRIALQRPVDAPDGQRGFMRTWQTMPGCSSVPASMEYSKPQRRGDESWQSHQVYPTAYVTFGIRYRPSVNINDIQRVVYGSRVFEIRSTMVPKERRAKILLQCEELQAKGTLH